MGVLGFDFAVEKLEPSYGTIKAYSVSWPGVSSEQVEEEITLKTCRMINGVELDSEYSRAREDGDQTEYLCPEIDTDLVLGGNYRSKSYQFIRVALEACSGSGNGCKDPSEIN